MKVLLINGSPHADGCTYTALAEVAKELNLHGVDTEIFHIGNQSIRGCIACNSCRKANKRCVFNDDPVNVAIEKAKDVDGFIFGSPVYYASANGSMVSFMDRFFYTRNGYVEYKPAACVVSARRAGTTAAYDQLNKYLEMNKMIMVPSTYWNMIHGAKASDALQDLEGLQIMRNLGKNMAWLLELLELGKTHNIQLPQLEPKIATSYIR